MARRKEMKKADYRALSTCYSEADRMAGKWHGAFGNEAPITVELGCGKAAFSYEMARRYPDRNFLGIDLKMDRMWKAATDADAQGMTNLAFLYAHLIHLPDQVGRHEVDELWITFPDPYPKTKQAKHRTINPPFLQLYQQALRPGGLVHYKTDNLALFHYSLEVFVRAKNIALHQITFDLHQDPEIHPDVKIVTDYERQFMDMGNRINYVCFSFLPID
jgi:tRNA (guanine-N7-)-methyltransferase